MITHPTPSQEGNKGYFWLSFFIPTQSIEELYHLKIKTAQLPVPGSKDQY